MTAHGVDRSGAAGGSGADDTPISESLITAKGDLIVGTASGAVDNLAVGTNEKRLVADSAEVTGLKYVADTTNYAVGAKGDLLAGTAADTVAAKAVGTDGYALQAQSGETTGLGYVPVAPFALENGYLDWSVSGSVLTVAIKTWAGTDPSTTDPVYIVFRSATAGTGSLVKRKLTAATSIAINDTALLGTTNSTAFRLWCVAFDDGGTVRLGLINCLSGTSIYPLAGWGIASSTLEDNGADSAHVFYTDGAAVTSKAYATIGFASWESGLATAGTWSAAPTRAQLFGLGLPLPGTLIQTQRNQTGTGATGTTAWPFDDTIPQNTEGDQFLSQAITPTSAANILDLNTALYVVISTASDVAGVGFFQDSTANAIAAGHSSQATGAANQYTTLAVWHRMQAGTTSSTTIKVRAGITTPGTLYVNRAAVSNPIFGGRAASHLTISELMA